MSEVEERSRFERMKVEVVSGGTQAEEPPAQADRTTMVLGIGAWVALFGVLALISLWMVVFVLALAISIILHELGHFWTARKSGMKATQFFLGFGPRVWSTHRNGVEYGLRAIPLGGFVKIIGMTNLDEVPEADEPATYRQATYPRRMWVITAGSVMHMIIAVVLIVVVYAVWGMPKESGEVTLARIVADSPADQAGFEPNDVVLSVDGTAVETSDEFRALLAAGLPDSEHTFEVRRGDNVITLTATLVQHPEVDNKVQGFLGVGSTSVEVSDIGVGEALWQGPRNLFVGVGQVTSSITKILNPVNVWGHLTGTNDDPTSRPGTIVGAVKISDDAGELGGWAGMLELIAVLNVSVGVFNMFPLLPLDGGHAAIATYERLRYGRSRKRLADVGKLMPVAAMCVMLLAFMFLTGLYLDTLGS